MKTHEEIKKGLDNCTRLGGCAACPYFDRGIAAWCTPILAADARAYIQQLEADRNRYWSWIRGMGCEACSGNCDECKDGSAWEWSGAREVDSGENA